LDNVDDKRQKKSDADLDFYTTKQDNEREAVDLDERVNELEKQLHNAKESRRRNSLNLEAAI